MKLLMHRWMTWAWAVVALAIPLAPAAAQTVKPVVVVSLASVEENLADVGYLTRAAGMEDAGKTAILLGNAFTSGLDKKRPAGMYIIPADGDFHGIAFAPISDLNIVLETFKEQIGSPKDAGDGVKEVGQGQTVFIKEQNGWVFVAQSKEHLANLPQDPAATLGNLPKQYNVAVRVLSQNVPAELKKVAIDEMRAGFERSLEANAGGDSDVDPEVVNRIGRKSIADMVQLIEESDEVLLGLAIDAATKKTYLDINVTAVQGSDLARKMAVLQETKSAFSGFLMPEASLTFNLTSTVTKEDAEQVTLLLQTARKGAMKEIDNDADLPAEKRDAAKHVLGKFLDVLDKTVQAGKIDGGAALVLEPKSIAFAGGMLVSDGKQLGDAFKELIDLAKDEPDFPKVKLNAGQHGNVTFHHLTAPIPEREAEARELLGEELNIVIGVGPKSAYVAFGKDAEGLLRKIIDQSAANADQAVPPMQLNVSLLPILKFIQSVDDTTDLSQMIRTLEQAQNDQISLIVSAIPRGVSYRLEMEDGVLKAIGDAAKTIGGGLPNLQGL